MMDPNVTWLRIFDHCVSALAYSAIAVLTGWLATRKFIGHRRILVTGCFFSITRSVTSISLMASTYNNDHSGHLVTILLSLSAAGALILAGLLLVSAGNLLDTLTGTEASEMVRKDRSADNDQKHFLFEHMAAENRRQSTEMLAQTAHREAQISG